MDDAQRKAALAAQRLQGYFMLAFTSVVGLFYMFHQQGMLALPQLSAGKAIGFVGAVLWLVPLISRQLARKHAEPLAVATPAAAPPVEVPDTHQHSHSSGAADAKPKDQ